MLSILILIISYPAENNPPNFPPLQKDVWSESLQQYIDWIDSVNPLPQELQYVSYLGMD
jgi:hypothetical protein